ncbi:uracil-xanthine permease family protein [Legionella nagasakiensis]|uniref:uracil-xanthine permease family protein n=1 Tax=Legionella nagasakiensis TaxID=535290 RepID=UPI001054ADF1|nr:solute carrier family 23 protein [Legionella nagasakiensis]
MDNSDLIYSVDDKPPLPKLILLGLQHVILMSVYLVLIVIIVRAAHLSDTTALNAVRMGMIALAIATTIQALRPPIGSGYLAAPVVSAIYLKASLLAADAGGLPLVLGMTIFSGFLEILFSRFSYRLRVIFPPGISGFIIAVVGIELGLEGLSQFLGVARAGAYNYEKHLLIGLLTLGTMVALSIWWHGLVKLICSFLGLLVGFITAYLLGAVDVAKITELKVIPYFALPSLSFISYNFSFSIILPFIVASIAAALRAVGVITTCQKINDPSWKNPNLKSIQGGIFADGMGAVIAGLCGSPGISTAPSLVGVSSSTGATSRYIAFAISIILFILAMLPKIASILLIMPMSVIGPALMFTGSFMIVGGIEVMTSRNVDTRMTYVIGLALLFGLSKEIYPAFYSSLPTFLQSITSTTLSLSVIVALTLHLIFRLGIRKHAIFTFESETDMPTTRLADFMLERGNQWKINHETIERITLTTKEMIQYIHHAHLAHGKTHVDLSYDQVDVLVEIRYTGDLLKLPEVNQNKKTFVEEEAFYYGLSDFLTGVYPDKFERSIIKNEVCLKLYFNI